jgi:hypothetical protein
MPRQPDLLPKSKSQKIPLSDNHPLIQLAEALDWDQMQELAQQIRLSKLKNAAGKPPHLRATLEAMAFMAVRRLIYREAEDRIQYYASSRYLCGLTETEWRPDFTTIQDFTQLMREEGVRHQSIRGDDGRGKEVGRPPHPGGRHHGVKSRDSSPQRNGTDGGLPAFSDSGGSESCRDTERVRASNSGSVRRD